MRRNVHHAEHLWSFDCEGGTHALAHAAYFADNGTLIRGLPVERRAYWPVAPDTLGKRIPQVACTLPSASGDLVDVRENATEAQEDAASSGSR